MWVQLLLWVLTTLGSTLSAVGLLVSDLLNILSNTRKGLKVEANTIAVNLCIKGCRAWLHMRTYLEIRSFH